jgi:hypothetical protein
MKMPEVDKVTVISAALLGLVYAVVIAVLFVPGSSDDLKTIVVQSVLLALAALTGYWLNSSADVAKKAEEQAKQPTPQVDVPAQTIDAIPPKDA